MNRALERAGRYLAQRPRTAHEVRAKLGSCGFEQAPIAAALERLEELGLVDDLDFARRFIAERTASRGRSVALVVEELSAKGIAPEIAERAAGEAGIDAESHAAQVALGLARKLAGLPLEGQARRLHAMLLRRGFAPEEATAGVRAVLPPEGWD